MRLAQGAALRPSRGHGEQRLGCGGRAHPRRSEAMRQAQLARLNDGRHERPYYCASFIVSRDDCSPNEKAVAPDLRVHPGVGDAMP